MSKTKNLLFFAVLLALALPSSAQLKQNDEDKVPEKDRPASDSRTFVELFSKLERDLGLALEKKDRAALDALLAPEFVERDAADPDHPALRSAWIDANISTYNLDPLGVRSLSIRAFMGNAVVSFVQKRTIPKSRPASDVFLVDVWVIYHTKWQLASRFQSPIPPKQPRHN